MIRVAGLSLLLSAAVLAAEPPLPPLPADLAGATAAPSQVRVDAIEFHGNRAVTTAELQAHAAPHVGRVNGVDELEALRQQLTRLYVDRGYVNSGLLLPQRLADGVLVFEVIEGRLGGVDLHGLDGLLERYVSARLLRPDDAILDMGELRERYQLLLADPQIARMNARLVPGPQLGEARLDVDVQRSRPWELSVFANNYRPASIGSAAGGLAGTLRNLSGRGDQFDLTLQAPLERSGQGGHGRMDWQLPLVTWGLTDTQLQLGLERGSSSVIEEPVDQLGIRSRLSSREVGISHVWSETLARKFDGGLTWLGRDNRTTLAGQPFSFTPGVPDGELREALWRGWLGSAWRSESQVLALRASYSWGHADVQDAPELPPSPLPARHFGLWVAQASYTWQVLDRAAQLAARLSWQYTGNHLLPLDALALGGLGTVRGFRQNQLVRDRGVFLNLELEVPLRQETADGWSLSLTPFLDLGHAANVGEPGATLSSLGLQARARWQGWTLDLGLAHRLQGARLGTTLQDRGVMLQLAYKL
jgi:hemolysin activation/secretion protein